MIEKIINSGLLSMSKRVIMKFSIIIMENTIERKCVKGKVVY